MTDAAAAMSNLKAATQSSPGRLDMMGGISDYSGGLVLQVATDVTTTVECKLCTSEIDEILITSEMFGDVRLSLHSLRRYTDFKDLNLTAYRKDLLKTGMPSWGFYVAGCIASFFRETGWLPPLGHSLNLFITSTVPIAQGVSSSASLECAVMKSLMEISGIHLPPVLVAHAACRAENHVVDAKCGLMDQLASMCGKPHQVLPILCRPDTLLDFVELPASVTVVGIPSGVKHDVGASPYLIARTATFMAKYIAQQITGKSFAFVTEVEPSYMYSHVLPHLPTIMTGRDYLDAYGVVEDPLSAVDPATSYPLAACLRFAVEETFCCRLAHSLLISCRGIDDAARRQEILSLVGELMYQSHAGYTAVGLGAAETDAIVETLRMLGLTSGIYGARVSGGGSGGTVVVLCERSAIELLRLHLPGRPVIS